MELFDTRTPTIIFHYKSPENERIKQLRFPFDNFPSEIRAISTDNFLLQTMESARIGFPSQRFIRYYQVLEYVTFYFIKGDIQRRLTRAISAPDAFNNPTKLVNYAIDVLSEDKISDNEKFTHMINELVDPQIIWSYIENNRDLFCCDTEFDGGFVFSSICRPNWTIDDFKSSWIPKLPDSLRRMRNALVHGREARTSRVITGTRENEEKISRYLGIMHLLALQCAAYRVY